MESFLQLVARSLLAKWGGDLSRTAVIFPNKRASLFLNDHLAAGGGTPLWAPRYMTVSEYFRALSPLRLADPIDTVCRLYGHYARLTGSAETLDAFYGWGERLLADFDDVDKNMAPPERLFRDLADYEEIGSDGFLDEEQTEQLRRFLDGFAKGSRTVIKEKYLALWHNLLPLYESLRADLRADGLAYEGQLFRSVAEAAERGGAALPAGVDRVAVVGFNVIDRAEHTLFTALRRQGKAAFYWDYDTYYARRDGSRDCEAGVFIQKNLRDFPNELSDEEACFGNFLRGREGRSLTFVSSPTDTAQAKSVTAWLRDPRNFNPKEARRTAVVMCNENLLQGVLHALPADRVASVNITKGFPLGQTAAYALVEKRMAAHVAAADTAAAERRKGGKAAEKAGEETPAEACRRFILATQESIQEAARQPGVCDDGTPAGILNREAYFQAYTTLSRFLLLVENGRLSVRPETLFRLLRQVMRGVSIPFHGEPAVGLQVMGVLETRCLDFENLLILSAEEGTLPQRAAEASFIPHLLRVRFGLTTSLHKTSVFSYYFHRMLQRARNVQISYNNSTQGTRRGEMSRFMRALLVESGLTIAHKALYAPPHPSLHRVGEIRKSAEWVRSVEKLSPSAINEYIRCPLAFYYHRVMGLPDERPSDEVIAPNVFGTLFHEAAQLFHEPFVGRPLSPGLLRSFGEDGLRLRLTDCVKRAFALNNMEETQIVFQAVYAFLRRLVEYEKRDEAEADIVIRGLERKAELHIDFPCAAGDGGTKRLCLHGVIDRFEEVGIDGLTRLRIIDYKTGGDIASFDKMEELFEDSKNHYTLQTFLYALMMEGETGLPLTPALYHINRLGQADYNPYIQRGPARGKKAVTDFREMAGEFKAGLVSLLSEIFDPDTPFGGAERKLPDERDCENCSFHLLCQR